VNRAVEAAPLGDGLGRPEQHRGVPVMAAGMHQAGPFARIGQAGLLLDRQRIDVGTDADGVTVSAIPQRADDAGPSEAAMHLIAQRSEPASDEVGGPYLLKAKLGMAVQGMSDGDEFRQVVLDEPCCVHVTLRGWNSVARSAEREQRRWPSGTYTEKPGTGAVHRPGKSPAGHGR
jgi:hypothetical protein